MILNAQQNYTGIAYNQAFWNGQVPQYFSVSGEFEEIQ